MADSLEALVSSGLPKELLDQQLQRVRSLFSRDLATPSAAIEESYEDYASWESTLSQPVPEHIKVQLEKTRKAAAQRARFEELIKDTPDAFTSYHTPQYDLLPAWNRYIDWETKKLVSHLATSANRSLNGHSRALNGLSGYLKERLWPFPSLLSSGTSSHHLLFKTTPKSEWTVPPSFAVEQSVTVHG